MLQKIKIIILNKLKKQQTVWIYRKNLDRYGRTETLIKGKRLWDKAKEIKKKVRTIKKKVGVVRKSGRTRLMDKKFVRFEFNLWRRKIADDDSLTRLMLKLIDNYNLVEKEAKNLPAMRLGLSVGTDMKEFKEFIHADTRRKSKKEIVDMISTMTYERGIESKSPMFDELMEKIRKIFLENIGYTITVDDDTILEALKFFVIYTEN